MPAVLSTEGAYLCAFSDASFNISAAQTYGQTGFVGGLAIPGADTTTFHALDWSSTKQRRVTYSSFGAEILACAESDDRCYRLRQALRDLLGDISLETNLQVDSRGLFDTVTTLHEGS